MVSSLEGIQKFLNCKGYPKKKEKEKSLRICLWVLLWMPIYQNCVVSLYQGFVFQFCDASELAYCAQENLPKFGYHPQEELPKLNGVAIGGGHTRHVIATLCE
jgi:hypothetical protein